jgi:preprotein translocase subunit SecY
MPEKGSPLFASFKKMASLPDLRKRVLFMLGLLAVCRLVAVMIAR